jgi:hypothetical protein
MIKSTSRVSATNTDGVDMTMKRECDPDMIVVRCGETPRQGDPAHLGWIIRR